MYFLTGLLDMDYEGYVRTSAGLGLGGYGDIENFGIQLQPFSPKIELINLDIGLRPGLSLYDALDTNDFPSSVPESGVDMGKGYSLLGW